MKNLSLDIISYLLFCACILVGIIYENIITVNIVIGFLILNELREIKRKLG